MSAPPEAGAGTDDALRRLGAVSASLRAEHDRWRAEAATRVAARGAAARRGDLGPGVRELQARVDDGLTTWAAVLDGRDRSVAAAEARRDVAERLVELARHVPPGDRGVRGR
ncbi:hypothetical protein ENKNEFLB_00624 [Nocardioides aquaticus]|uniref:Uncharacterized protein n=1 Tax=Nocardioides aquaticus TaxID=160826 RepID=A0ABX8EDC7_9ACTN|nr:hypothetical protein [Nocardioides aquaticus]QVT78251.1 hypothetical protein ENKNEFLB_00624 [Nocardioides aquaticus]